MVWLGRIIILVGCALYVGAIGYAGWAGLPKGNEVPNLGAFAPTVITLLGGAFATVFGAAFGISDNLLFFLRPNDLAARLNWPATTTIIAATYFVALVVGSVFLVADPEPAKVAEPIRDIFKTLLGAIAGVIYVQAAKK